MLFQRIAGYGKQKDHNKYHDALTLHRSNLFQISKANR